MTTVSVRLPDSLHRKATEFVQDEGFSLEQFIASATAEKLAAFAAERYLEDRAKRGNREKLAQVLTEVPDVEPDEDDHL